MLNYIYNIDVYLLFYEEAFEKRLIKELRRILFNYYKIIHLVSSYCRLKNSSFFFQPELFFKLFFVYFVIISIWTFMYFELSYNLVNQKSYIFFNKSYKCQNKLGKFSHKKNKKCYFGIRLLFYILLYSVIHNLDVI